MNQIFEKAGFKVLDWKEVSPVVRAVIQGGQTQDKTTEGAKAPENKLRQAIYGKPKAWDGVYYFVKKTSEGYLWSRIWLDGKGVSIESLVKYPTPSDVSDILREREFGQKPKTGNEIAKGVRNSSVAALANSLKKNGAR